MKGELLVLHVIGAYPHIGRFHQRLGTGAFAALAADHRKVVEGAQLAHGARTHAREQKMIDNFFAPALFLGSETKMFLDWESLVSGY